MSILAEFKIFHACTQIAMCLYLGQHCSNTHAWPHAGNILAHTLAHWCQFVKEAFNNRPTVHVPLSYIVLFVNHALLAKR